MRHRLQHGARTLQSVIEVSQIFGDNEDFHDYNFLEENIEWLEFDEVLQYFSDYFLQPSTFSYHLLVMLLRLVL